MNVSQLIAELQKLPQHLPVRGYMTLVTCCESHTHPADLNIQDNEALEVDGIQYRGYDVVLECGGIAA